MKKNTAVSTQLIFWYRENKRNLPWRNTNDPYKIWLSEIILQQTRVDQGLSYYNRFVSTYPDIFQLAAANEQEVLKLWQGLGYYSRARNLHHAAKEVVEKYNGVFPDNYTDILKLKGVGSYTAAAIASFAFNLPHPVIDGNVIRVISRLFGIQVPVDMNEGKKEIEKRVQQIFDPKQANLHNQAIMEFGAMVCTPASPDCENCFLAYQCAALKRGLTGELPLKSKSVKVRERYFHYLILRSGQKVMLQKRTGRDIWQNMYEFPLIEMENNVLEPDVNTYVKNLLKNDSQIKFRNKSAWDKQILTHQKIHARFWLFEIADVSESKHDNRQFVNEDAISGFPVPKLIERHIHDC